jgi:hypothetical protein
VFQYEVCVSGPLIVRERDFHRCIWLDDPQFEAHLLNANGS